MDKQITEASKALFIEYAKDARQRGGAVMMITGVCAWCEAVKPPAERVGADGTLVSHGICSAHKAEVLADLRRRAAEGGAR